MTNVHISLLTRPGPTTIPGLVRDNASVKRLDEPVAIDLIEAGTVTRVGAA